MLQKLFRWFTTIIGVLIGVVVCKSVLTNTWVFDSIHIKITTAVEGVTYLIFAAVFGIIFYIFFPLLVLLSKRISAVIEKSLEDVQLIDVGLSVFGLIIGLIIALLISFAISQIPVPWVSSLLTALVYIIMGYIGFTLPAKKRDEIIRAIRQAQGRKPGETGNTVAGMGRKLSRKKSATEDKILDTSVIIDGRIYDIFKTGFLEGKLVVPVFVLGELQLLADNSDDLKRAKGRRGLDIVKKMQNEFEKRIQVSEEDYDDLQEVDDKLLRMAKNTKFKILTNDYNLNKVATVRGVGVLNINELANAVKPVVLPGEEMRVQPVKNGKESGQAVAYLEDGTMIVVENGKRHIGEYISVTVTSILQTAAGRMIFARPSRI